MSDFYRDQAIRNQLLDNERRALEIAAETSRQIWFEWNGPTGFWARMKRDDERFQYLQELNARTTETFHQRSAEIAAELARLHSTHTPGDLVDLVSGHESYGSPRLDDLVGKEPPDVSRSAEELALYARAYHSRFSDDESLTELWKRAKEDAKNFDRARSEFWRLVNNDDSAAADRVRAIIEAAGYERMGGDRAPVLRMELYDLVRESDETRRRYDLTLSIDHIATQKDNRHLALEESNLRFMSVRDNAFRGAWFDEKDIRLKEPKKELDAAHKAFRERVEELRRQSAAAHQQQLDDRVRLAQRDHLKSVEELALQKAEDIRRQDRDEEIRRIVQTNERHVRELAAEANLASWFYWNDPNNGFWARFKRDDERFQWLREQSSHMVRVHDLYHNPKLGLGRLTE